MYGENEIMLKQGGGADIGSATSEVIMHSMYIVLVIIHISY